MKTMLKRCLALLLVLQMFFGWAPVSAFAVETDEHDHEHHLHILEETPAVPASCTQDGNIAYWTCIDPACGLHFADADAAVALEEGSWVLPAAHSTVMDEAVGYWNCTGCGQYFEDEAATQVIDAEQLTAEDTCAHEMTGIAAKAATCLKDGNSAYWTCSVCGLYFSDAEGTTAIDEGSWVIPAKGSHGEYTTKTVEASCTSPAGTVKTCVDCGHSYYETITGAALTGYVWDFSTGSATSVAGENTLTVRTTTSATDESYKDLGSTYISNGTLNAKKYIYKLSKPVTLKSSEDWTLEIVAKGDGTNAIRTAFSNTFGFGSASTPTQGVGTP